MDINFNTNEDHNKLLLSDLKQHFSKIKLGGGEKRIEKLQQCKQKNVVDKIILNARMNIRAVMNRMFRTFGSQKK